MPFIGSIPIWAVLSKRSTHVNNFNIYIFLYSVGMALPYCLVLTYFFRNKL